MAATKKKAPAKEKKEEVVKEIPSGDACPAC